MFIAVSVSDSASAAVVEFAEELDNMERETARVLAAIERVNDYLNHPYWNDPDTAISYYNLVAEYAEEFEIAREFIENTRVLEAVEWLERTMAWLESDEAKQDPEYSDVYKDVYGIRPRWLYE